MGKIKKRKMSKTKDHQRYNFWDYAIKYKRNNQQKVMEEEMKDTLEDLITQGLVKNGIFYTFTTLGKDGKRYYPSKPLAGKVVGAGLLDFDWSEDVSKAITWYAKEDVKTIALEFCNTEIIRIDDNGKTKKYTVIETME